MMVSLVNADVTAQSSITLTNPVLPEPDGRELDFRVNSLRIRATGDLTDKPGIQVRLAGNLDATVSGHIKIADQTNELVQVSGRTHLESTTDSIQLGKEGTVDVGEVNLLATKGDLAVGGIGLTQLGIISATSTNIRIEEDSALTVHKAIATNSLSLMSSSSITNTESNIANESLGIKAKDLHIVAETYAHLGPVTVISLTAKVGANGTLNDSGLLALNTFANSVGQQYLNAASENLAQGVGIADSLLSGETLAELRARASYIESFGREYGLFVQNSQRLVLESIQAIGDGINMYIETFGDSDLFVDGTVRQYFTEQDPGGIVLIAGGSIEFAAGAALEIQSLSLDPSTHQVVLQPKLVANAFNAATGPIGFESTRDVLYASDAFADTGTQNVLQRVSTRFGVSGEAGFQTLIRYADGASQLFTTSEQLHSSLFAGVTSSLSSGVLPAYPNETGNAAVFQRQTPFEDTFLGTFQTLPTSAIFRRSGEFFLFEKGGALDSATLKVDLTPVVDQVEGVLSPGRKVSFSMPTDIVVTPAFMIAPIRQMANTETVYPIVSTHSEGRVLSEAKFEVFIVNVGFNDVDRDGQPSDTELPLRNEVQIASISGGSLSESPAANSSPDRDVQAEAAYKRFSLAAGEVNFDTKDVKGSDLPTSGDVQKWINEYQDDPTRPTGAYAVITVDSITGAKVVKVFGIRDFSADSEEGIENKRQEEKGNQPGDVQADETPHKESGQPTSMLQTLPEDNPAIDRSEPSFHEVFGIIPVAAVSILSSTTKTGEKFSRLSRRLRTLSRKYAEGLS